MVVRFWTGNDGTGTLLFTSPALSGTNHGGESGEITFDNFYPPINLSCLQVYKADGDDLGPQLCPCVLHAGRWNRTGDFKLRSHPHDYGNAGDLTNHNTTWFNTAHKRSIIYNGNGADAGSVATQYLVWGTSDYLNANTYSRTGYTYAGGWSSSSSRPGPNTPKRVFTDPAGQQHHLFTRFGIPLRIRSLMSATARMEVRPRARRIHTMPIKPDGERILQNRLFLRGLEYSNNGSGTSFSDGKSVRNLSSVQDTNVVLHAQWTDYLYG